MFFFKELSRAALLSAVLLILCGVAYPFALTGLSQVVAPEKANGSLVYFNDKAVGSALVGQTFTAPHFMQSRPSAVSYNVYTPEAKESGSYAGVASGSANMAPSNPALVERVSGDLQAFLAAHPGVIAADIPADLLTASGSGLDPHISPKAAEIQLPALALHSGLSMETLRGIVSKHTTGRVLGIFGEPVVQVLGVNMDIQRAMNSK